MEDPFKNHKILLTIHPYGHGPGAPGCPDYAKQTQFQRPNSQKCETNPITIETPNLRTTNHQLRTLLCETNPITTHFELTTLAEGQFRSIGKPNSKRPKAKKCETNQFPPAQICETNPILTNQTSQGGHKSLYNKELGRFWLNEMLRNQTYSNPANLPAYPLATTVLVLLLALL